MYFVCQYVQENMKKGKNTDNFFTKKTDYS